MGTNTKAVIQQLFSSKDSYIRLYCLKVLGRDGGGEDVRSAIIHALKQDPDPVVRHEAAFWLGELGDREATDALAEAIKNDPSPLVRHESVEALGWIPTAESKKALEIALHDADETVRKTAQISLNIHKHPRDDWESSTSNIKNH